MPINARTELHDRGQRYAVRHRPRGIAELLPEAPDMWWTPLAFTDSIERALVMQEEWLSHPLAIEVEVLDRAPAPADDPTPPGAGGGGDHGR